MLRCLIAGEEDVEWNHVILAGIIEAYVLAIYTMLSRKIRLDRLCTVL